MAARYGAHVWERHVHEELVLSISEAGTGVCETRDGAACGGPGTFWIFAPGEAHQGFVEADWQYRGAYLGERSLRELAGAFDAERVRALHVPPGLYRDEQLARLLLDAHRCAESDAPLLTRQSAWSLALGTLFTRYGHPRPRVPDARVSERRLRVAREYLEAHFCEDVAIDDLARLCGLSRFHFMRAFRARYGIAPHAYLVQVRVNRAKRLLAEGRSATEVAFAAGFADQSALTRHFKRAFGVPPGAYARAVAAS
ncbi:MAG TPA: AraC family transcriptional regulator [Candidatus Sulfotelmatobacter sp.]|nr:AraC family transcriptional regulator [Candidatus Sulfotelmatobacter sp.]